MNDRIVSITFPKCGSCRYAQAFKNDKMADCHGMPPVPMMLGTSQDALGRPQVHMETFVPRVKEDRPGCSLYIAKQDFVTSGRS